MPDNSKMLFIKVTEDQAAWIGAYLNVVPQSLMDGIQNAFDLGVERIRKLTEEAELEPWVLPAYMDENSAFRIGWRNP